MASDVILFDDDTFFAGLVRELLSAHGLRVLYYPGGEGALEHIRRERPRVVLTDIMMPGVDGITLCGSIKRDPELARTKVVIVSGKGYQEDRTRADSASADRFFQKPLNITEFGNDIRALVGETSTPFPAGAPAPSLRFFSDGPAPGTAALRLGRRLFLFDAGKGLKRALDGGEGRMMEEAWVLLSSDKPECAAELRALRQLTDAGCALHLVGGDRARLERFALLLRPARLGDRAGAPEIHEIREGAALAIGSLRLSAMAALHPGVCLAYRLEGSGASVVYAPYSELEPEWESSLLDYGEKLTAFAKGAGLLVHDARYLARDLPGPSGSGHSTPEAALRLALRCGAGRLALHGLDKRYSPRERREIEEAVRGAASGENGRLQVMISADRCVAEAR